MPWLIIIIFAYFILAVVGLVDKYLLGGPIPNPKVYAFCVGVLGILSLFLIPFVQFLVPSFLDLILTFVAGTIYIFALFGFFNALKLFEASRVVPAIGGFLPLFTFLLTFLLGNREVLKGFEIISFILLISGSVLIALQIPKWISLKSLQISALTAFLFALTFILTKFVYLSQPFWSGFIWMRMSGFFIALFFLFAKEVREELFKKRVSLKPKTTSLFLLNQAMGGGAFVLQNWAIALVPLSLLAFINALEGTKYVFLLAITVLLSLKFPKILKEGISKKVLFQKIIAILLIGMGLTLLALK